MNKPHFDGSMPNILSIAKNETMPERKFPIMLLAYFLRSNLLLSDIRNDQLMEGRLLRSSGVLIVRLFLAYCSPFSTPLVQGSWSPYSGLDSFIQL